MGRALVLFACVMAAAGVAGYTHFSQREAEPVYTVRAPHRLPDPVAPKPKAVAPIPGDRASLTRELQRELKRVGCYGGDISGVWTTSSRMAMKSFTDRVNASLPMDNPDQVLLSLVRGHEGKACSASCPAGQALAQNGQCMPSAVLTRAPANSGPETNTEQPPEKSAMATGSIFPAAAATVAAIEASADSSKGEQKARSEDKARPATTSSPSNDSAIRGDRTEKPARTGGPVPSERVHDRRSRRSSNRDQPPKFVRNLLRAFGIN